MKKFIVLGMALLCTITASAQLNENERNFMTKLKTYLTNEGFNAFIDSDNDLQFKREGKTLWFSVEEESNGYFYVKFHMEHLKCTDANVYSVRKAVNRVCREYKVGKCYLSTDEKYVTIVINSFCQSYFDITRYFYRYVSVLTGMYNDLKEYYDEYNN